MMCVRACALVFAAAAPPGVRLRTGASIATGPGRRSLLDRGGESSGGTDLKVQNTRMTSVCRARSSNVTLCVDAGDQNCERNVINCKSSSSFGRARWFRFRPGGCGSSSASMLIGAVLLLFELFTSVSSRGERGRFTLFRFTHRASAHAMFFSAAVERKTKQNNATV